tara:strand:- start:42994 stop:43581 length:588 start_codon:yes stop_codon:yes gene_type:complete
MRYLALLALASCGTLTTPDFFHRPAQLEDLVGGAAAVSLEPEPFVGRFRVMHGPSACASAIVGQGNPLVWPSATRPRAGEPTRVDWTLNPTPPYEARAALLMVWFDETPAPIDMTAFGYTGCLLWAPTQLGRVHTITPKDGTMLTQSGGAVSLTWTPSLQWVGRKLFCQLAVHSPGANAQGWLLSPGLETWVGNR